MILEKTRLVTHHSLILPHHLLLACIFIIFAKKISFMALTRLPTELRETIITHVLPEDFESVAVTCKKIYALCIPFIQRHNALRSRFYHFTYYGDPYDPSPTIGTAAELIRRIAVEPCYVRHANLQRDSPRSYTIPGRFLADTDCREDVTRLFANYPDLEQARLTRRNTLTRSKRSSTRRTPPLLTTRCCFPFDTPAKYREACSITLLEAA